MNLHKSLVINAEPTPNPNTIKFSLNRTLCETGSVNFTDAASAQESALAKALFRIPNVEGVMIGKDFISVTKLGCADWHSMTSSVSEAIRSALTSEDVLISNQPQTTASSGDSEVVKKIKEILDNEIRPALAMDGGDVTFVAYEQGVVKLHLQGSCRHCPSAVMTLKMGVESRLRSLIPEVQEVIPV